MTEKTETPIQNLTIYLAKPSHKSPTALLKDSRVLDKYTIASGSSSLGMLFVQPSSPKAPRWARFFEDYVEARKLGKVSSTAAVLITKAERRLFAVTFGQGRHLLAPETWEERFGLRVALNCIGENSVRSIDKRTFDSIARHSREQASREVAAREFGLDIEQDLLRAVTGTPSDPGFGKRIYGMDALSMAINITIEDLPSLLSRIFEKSRDDSYRKNFPWVDQIAEISGSALQQELKSVLVDRIKSGHRMGVWMAVPEIVPWERGLRFRYSPSPRSPEYHDIHLDTYLRSIKDPSTINTDTFFGRHVHCVDDDGVTLERWPAFRCLYCELDYKGDSYLLSGGKWYRVTRDFVAQVNQAFQRIPRYAYAFPEYDDKSETDYNERVAKADSKAISLMDRKTIPFGGGYNPIEFCDLYSKDHDIIHVKRYGSSSVLSHLFAQGLTSGELFQTEALFRAKVNEKLPKKFRLPDTSKRPTSEEYQVVFAVISDSPGNLRLPFFSRLNLKHAARRLQGYGYRVAVAKIPVKLEHARWRKLR